jgi:MFS superfamily sulfate permease-like transporter
MKSIFSNVKADLSASIVVFFVALPLCLGIALASGAPLFSGIIAGIIGGIIVGAASKSKFGVSGPAAGLAAIVLFAIPDLGGFEFFLAAVVIAGVMQILFAILRFGTIAQYFPSSVIKGMLAGIGMLIILKQIPHAFGYDTDFEGDESFWQIDGENTFTAILSSFNHISFGALIVSAISLLVLIFWDKLVTENFKPLKIIPATLLVVVLGVVYTFVSPLISEAIVIEKVHLVSVPIANSFNDFIHQFSLPNFALIGESKLWITAVTIAVVASIETLLCVEATDKLDPTKQITPPNRELLAQGIGNTISGLIGGLPITQVIVRSSANIQSNAKSKLSTIFHGAFLLFAIAFIGPFLNKIPLAVLAVILILVGYKLAKPSLFREMYKAGWSQFIPFIATIIGILFLDLLKGIGIGMFVGIFFILYRSYKNSHYVVKETREGMKIIQLAEEVTFMNKARLLKELSEVEKNSTLVIDRSKSRYLDYDVIEMIEDFKITAKEKNIHYTIKTT